MEFELIGGVALAPVILALVALVRRTWPGIDMDRFGGALAVLFGVVIAVLYAVSEGQHVGNAALLGLLIGLSASGLYSTQHAARRIRAAEQLIDPEARRDE